MSETPFTAIEFGVLREWELPAFLEQLPDLDVSRFDYVSMHACKLDKMTEAEFVRQVEPVLERGWNIINHPDLLTDWDLWRSVGPQLCVENMDGRKPVGNTVREMTKIFEHLPEASMCFDIGHAKLVDPTMGVAQSMCKKFGDRIREIHLSDVVDDGSHRPVDHNSLRKFSVVADVLPEVPIILESGYVSSVEDEVLYILQEFPRYGMMLKTR